MHPEQDLEGAQELPLCVDTGSGKDFMDAAGYVTPVDRLPPMSRAPVVNRDSAHAPATARKPFPPAFPSPSGPREGTERARVGFCAAGWVELGSITAVLRGRVLPRRVVSALGGEALGPGGRV